MSLEQALAENTAAVKELISALSADSPKKAAKGKAVATVAETPLPQATPPATQPQPTVTPGAAGPDLKTVADFFMALAGKSRDTAIAIAVKYGADANQPKLSQVAADKLGAVLADCHTAAGQLSGGLVRNAAGVVEFVAAAVGAGNGASSLI